MALRLPVDSSRRCLSIALAALVAGGCGGGDEGQSRGAMPRVSIPDSVRARRNARLASRPDTMGTRVDSLRIDGVPGAKLFLVVVSDFQCAACRTFARDVLPALRKEYVETGIARLAFINAPQDANFNARFAAHAALCAASSGRFWAMHDTLFATQAAWARNEDPRPLFDSLAVSAGVDRAVQERCTERQPLVALLSGDMDRSAAAGVTSVPTLIIGDQRLSGARLTLPIIRRAVEAARR